jgi:hypothetical protein
VEDDPFAIMGEAGSIIEEKIVGQSFYLVFASGQVGNAVNQISILGVIQNVNKLGDSLP